MDYSRKARKKNISLPALPQGALASSSSLSSIRLVSKTSIKQHPSNGSSQQRRIISDSTSQNAALPLRLASRPSSATSTSSLTRLSRLKGGTGGNEKNTATEEIATGKDRCNKSEKNGYRQNNTKDVIDYSLVCARNIPNKKDRDKICDTVSRLTHIRLDHVKISKIDNLDFLGNVTHLYLQHNTIGTIENLNCLPSLRFLILAHNEILHVGGLSSLSHLQLLDLTHNAIEIVNAEAIPQSVTYLMLAGNPCAHIPSYRLDLVSILQNLEEIDEVEITDEERRLARSFSVCDDNQSDTESPQEEMADDDVEAYERTMQGIIHRSRARQMEIDAAYVQRVELIKRSLLERREHMMQHIGK